MITMKRTAALAAAAAGLACAQARAHATLEPDAVVAAQYAKVAVRVSHGCDGAPTRRVEVHLPPVFLVAKPQPKPGWTVSTRLEPVRTDTQLHGKPVARVVAQVTWEGGALPDDQFDDFVLLVRAPEAPGPVPIRVRQVCDRGEQDWNEVADSPSARPRNPAPVLKVVPAEHDGHAH